MNANKDDWKIWDSGDDTWLARTKHEAIIACLTHYGYPVPDVVTESSLRELGEEEGLYDYDEVEPLSEESLDQRRMWSSENMEPTALEHWQCECGAMADLGCRWNGSAYEHHHPYPVGHVLMKNIHHRTFRERLAECIAEGPKAEMFSSSNI